MSDTTLTDDTADARAAAFKPIWAHNGYGATVGRPPSRPRHADASSALGYCDALLRHG
jgi:hypothetical protein